MCIQCQLSHGNKLNPENVLIEACEIACINVFLDPIKISDKIEFYPQHHPENINWNKNYEMRTKQSRQNYLNAKGRVKFNFRVINIYSQ